MIRFDAVLQQFHEQGEKTGWTYLLLPSELAEKLDLHEKPLSSELMDCLADEPKALQKFNTLPRSHQKYFSNWIESAKTDATKTKRIAQAVIALSMGLGFSEMVKMNKK